MSDEVLESLSELPTLEDQYVDIFSRKDWDLQIEGLERFDKQSGFNIFQDDRFLNDLESLEKLVPEDKDVKEAAVINNNPKTESKPTTKPAQTSQTSSYPPLVKMKLELKEYIEREYEGTEELPSNLSVTELRKWYDMMNEGKMLPFDEVKKEDSRPEDDLPFDDEPPVDKTKASTEAPSSVSDRLSKLRSRMKK